MVLTPSTMLELGTTVPAFRLPDVNGKMVSSDDLTGTAGLLVAFICPHCPFVKHLRTGLGQFGTEFAARGLAIVAINSNDPVAYPEDGHDGMLRETAEARYEFPYLVDESQEVAQAFRAACTPDFFLFDGARKLVYRGQFDDSRPGQGKPVTGADLRAAAEALLGGQPVIANQKASIGCSIKWKVGNEPDYFRV